MTMTQRFTVQFPQRVGERMQWPKRGCLYCRRKPPANLCRPTGRGICRPYIFAQIAGTNTGTLTSLALG
jgi:hypothetical protein